MKRKIITTADGSKTIQIEEWNEQYHSIHGAKQEAEHVYIKHGLLFFINTFTEIQEQSLSILEIGFGTGLNAYLTLIEAQNQQQKTRYTGVEAYPVLIDEINELNYQSLCDPSFQSQYQLMHQVQWEAPCTINKLFILNKEQKYFDQIKEMNHFHLIYFDAFGPRVQPELWEESMFLRMYEALKTPGVLVTYSAKGSVRRAMEAVGFKVERLEGPPGKREMLRAQKL